MVGKAKGRAENCAAFAIKLFSLISSRGIFAVVRSGVGSAGGSGQIVIVGRGRADIVEQFGDFEFGGGFFFGGQFLDRLARRLKLGLFGRTCNVQFDCALTSGCRTTETSCRPSSLIGAIRTTCLRSTEKPSSVARSAASRVVTEP